MSHFTQPANWTIPDDVIEMPDEYLDRARRDLRSDLNWIAGELAELIDESDVSLILEATDDQDRRHCDRMRSVINTAIEREAPDLAESLWQRDIEDSRQAAAEYAADCSDY